MFDANAYLGANPDVRAAVEAGAMPSAWQHFVHFGYQEGRAGISPELQALVERVRSHHFATPPLPLIERVHGSADAATFLEVGQRITLDLLTTMTRVNAEVRGGVVLDFGCGCGRVAAHFAKESMARKVVGTDIDAETVGWARANLPSERMSWSVNVAAPPLCFGPAQFDVVYSISVFTHLPEEMQHDWLAELARVTRRGGLVFLSTSNDRLIRPHLQGETLAELEARGFYYHAFKSTPGLPDFYQAAWHTHEYIRREWSRHFEIVEVIPQGIAGHQDLVVGRKR